MFNTKLLGVIPLFSLAVIAAVACGDSTSSGPSVAGGNASWKFPHSTLTDWVSYADQVSVLTVLEEEEIPPPPEVIERGEGYIGRRITVRVEETVWARSGAPSVVGEFQTRVLGWTMHDSERRPTVLGGAYPRLEVGDRYLSPLVMSDGEWVTLSSEVVLPLAGDVVASFDVMQGTRALPLVEEMIGKTVDEVASLVAETSPDPLAVQYAELEPVERVEAVQQATAAGGEQ